MPLLSEIQIMITHDEFSKNITDLLKKYPCYELDYRLDAYLSEDDFEKLGQLNYIKREISWMIEDFEDESCAIGKALNDALKLKKASKNFKQLPSFKTNNFANEIRANENKYNDAKNLIKDYKNALKLQKELSRL